MDIAKAKRILNQLNRIQSIAIVIREKGRKKKKKRSNSMEFNIPHMMFIAHCTWLDSIAINIVCSYDIHATLHVKNIDSLRRETPISLKNIERYRDSSILQRTRNR